MECGNTKGGIGQVSGRVWSKKKYQVVFMDGRDVTWSEEMICNKETGIQLQGVRIWYLQ